MDLPKRNPIIHLLYILCVLSMLPFLIWIHWQTSALAATSEQINAVQLSKLDQKSKLNQTHTSQALIKQPKMISGVSAVIVLENAEQQIEKLWASLGYAKLIDLLAKNNNRVYVVYTDFNAQKRTVNLTLGFTGQSENGFRVHKMIEIGAYEKHVNKTVLELWARDQQPLKYSYQSDYEVWHLDSALQTKSITSYLRLATRVTHE